MRKALLSFVITLTAATAIIAQNPLPNQGFEDWTEHNGNYWEPNDWNSANQCTEILSTYSVTQTDVAHTGNYAVQLRTRDAFFGSIKINGLLSTSQVVCSANSGGIEGGIASDLIPDSIAFWYKYAPVNVDSAYVQVILLNGEDTLSYLKGRIHQAASEWTRTSFAIPAPSGTPALISVLLNSSWGDGSAGQAFVGSVFTVDDIEFVLPTSIEDEQMATGYNVYPNPAQDVLNISNANGSSSTLEVFDASGRAVLKYAITQGQTQIDISNLPAGLYVYQLLDSKNITILTNKLLKGI